MINKELKLHFGELLKDIMKNKKVSVKELAERTNTSKKYIVNIIKNKQKPTPDFAEKLGVAFGSSTEFWARLMKKYEK